MSNTEPNNFIIPYLAKRKVINFNEAINSGVANLVTGTLTNLYAKVDRVSNPEYQPGYSKYISACDQILGFRITASTSESGKKGVYIVKNDESISLSEMGEGTASAIGLIVDLCRAENKLFIIEEPENDIHPGSLKKLLDLIIDASASNQFVISTHSNIVVRYLAAHRGAKLFSIETEFPEKVPTSTVSEVNDLAKRTEVLENLGYELFDLGISDYWIFFEESSAERIVRDFLIPWFLPEIAAKIRTFSAASLSGVTPKFEDFNRLFVYLHLQQIYKNKAWVIVDGGEQEKVVIDKLKETYKASGWDEDSFLQWSEHDFEKYYPSEFQVRVASILEIQDKKLKRQEKKALLEDVVNWVQADVDHAKSLFQQSAADCVALLKKIFHSK